jgi:general secretion pathway protein H
MTSPVDSRRLRQSGCGLQSGCGPQSGFTLLEMIVVVVILGLAMGLLMTHGPVRSRTMQTRSVAAQMAQTLRDARGRAIAGDRPVQVVLDLARRAMSGGERRLLRWPSDIAVSVVATTGETGRTLAGFRFDPDGGATGGRIDLRDAGGLHLQVGVDWLTGRVSVVDVRRS